MDEVI